MSKGRPNASLETPACCGSPSPTANRINSDRSCKSHPTMITLDIVRPSLVNEKHSTISNECAELFSPDHNPLIVSPREEYRDRLSPTGAPGGFFLRESRNRRLLRSS